jgi:hypothetical protein
MPGKKGRPKGSGIKNFCSRGHDISIVGRYPVNRECNQCIKDKRLNRNGPKNPGAKKQFCPKGHDTWICGREKGSGVCNLCRIVITQKWQSRNKQILVEYNKEWRKKHPEVVSAVNLKHKTNRNLRIVIWTDWDEINKFERNKPKGMTTDHYIPLQGKLVSGLHVSWNLRYLTKSENSKKCHKVDLLEVSNWYGKILEEAGLK